MSVTGRRVIPIKRPGEETQFRTIGGGITVFPPTNPTSPSGPIYTQPPDGVSWVEWGTSGSDGYQDSVGWYGWEGYYTMLYFQALHDLNHNYEQVQDPNNFEAEIYDMLNLYQQAMIDVGAGAHITDTAPMEVMLSSLLMAGFTPTQIAAGIDAFSDIVLKPLGQGLMGSATPVLYQGTPIAEQAIANWVMHGVITGLTFP